MGHLRTVTAALVLAVGLSSPSRAEDLGQAGVEDVKAGLALLERATRVETAECEYNAMGRASNLLLRNDPQWSPRCNGFVRPDGSYGPWAMTLHASMLDYGGRSDSNPFLSPPFPAIENVCPKFHHFDSEQKLRFWIHVFASIAMVESSCKATVEVQGSNGVATGLLQLEKSAALRESRGPVCASASVGTASDNLRCGVELMYDQLMGPRGRLAEVSNGHLYNPGSYWQKLRRQGGGTIGAYIRQLPSCL